MSATFLDHLAQALQQELQTGVDEQVFSGAQASFCICGGAVHTVTAGHTAYPFLRTENRQPAFPIEPDTLFDIASLTKLFTATIALRLVDNKKLTLQSHMWNGFSLEALLAHETGLPAWQPYFKRVPLNQRATPGAYKQIIKEVLDTPATPPMRDAAVYSDVGFIGLGHQLQQITGQSLPTLVKDVITIPLQMGHTAFGAKLPPSSANIACTENCPWRGRILKGEVHDDNAWTMGGVAGHAGLFSTSEDMVRLGMDWLDALKGDGIISLHLAKQSVARRKSGRGLGFDMVTAGASSVGDFAGDATFGHLGFTGTSIWMDPKKDAVICLLTNRVHPTRDNIRIRRFRPSFHNIFFSVL
ncbi:MAG: beta-lactamase family protein [Deltaproteobacteria bacterium]|nr:beta-lactamase family protein [Deltaproteobacteria bacterium]